MMLYYRKDLFEEYGIKPEELQTWEDMAIIGEELQDSQGQRMLALDGTLFDVLLRQKGSDLFDEKAIFCLMKKWQLMFFRSLRRCLRHKLR
jgi:ABC-type glycerol-3-phosphate transport system substrate-binding protein